MAFTRVLATALAVVHHSQIVCYAVPPPLAHFALLDMSYLQAHASRETVMLGIAIFAKPIAQACAQRAQTDLSLMETDIAFQVAPLGSF
jgi:hypothetical protein